MLGRPQYSTGLGHKPRNDDPGLVLFVRVLRWARIVWHGISLNADPLDHDNHAAKVAINSVHYNFSRTRKTIRLTPVMAAGLSESMWNL